MNHSEPEATASDPQHEVSNFLLPNQAIKKNYSREEREINLIRVEDDSLVDTLKKGKGLLQNISSALSDPLIEVITDSKTALAAAIRGSLITHPEIMPEVIPSDVVKAALPDVKYVPIIAEDLFFRDSADNVSDYNNKEQDTSRGIQERIVNAEISVNGLSKAGNNLSIETDLLSEPHRSAEYRPELPPSEHVKIAALSLEDSMPTSFSVKDEYRNGDQAQAIPSEESRMPVRNVENFRKVSLSDDRADSPETERSPIKAGFTVQRGPMSLVRSATMAIKFPIANISNAVLANANRVGPERSILVTAARRAMRANLKGRGQRQRLKKVHFQLPKGLNKRMSVRSLDPNMLFVQRWLKFMVLPLSYEMWAFPYRLALCFPTITPNDTNSTMYADAVCDAIFVLDMLVSLTTAIAVPGREEQVTSFAQISRHYFTCIFPFQMLPSVLFWILTSLCAGRVSPVCPPTEDSELQWMCVVGSQDWSLWLWWASTVPRVVPRFLRLRSYFKSMERNLVLRFLVARHRLACGDIGL